MQSDSSDMYQEIALFIMLYATQRCILLVICGLLILTLAACSVGGDYAAVVTAVPSPSLPALHLRTYRGPGYTIGYPQNWLISQDSSASVTFADPHGLAYIRIEVLPNPGAILSANADVPVTQQAGEFRVGGSIRGAVPSTTRVGGESWSQRAATGSIVVKNRSISFAGKMVEIADNHPASSPATRFFVIAYAAAQQVFDVANVTYFRPMLQSFKFN